VLFVCVHNAGRSQMAAGFLHHSAGDLVEIRSAGSEPADSLNSTAVAAMTEVGIDITDNRPALLAAEDVRASDVVITMGCGDACPVFPGTRYEDWALDDPAGQSLDAVRRIRDEICSRVETLVTELAPEAEIAPESVLAPMSEPAGPVSDGHRNTSTSNAEEAPHA
jgi:arsenate reductase